MRDAVLFDGEDRRRRLSRALEENTIRTSADQWANEANWDLVTVTTKLDDVVVRVTGPLPLPDTDRFAQLLIERGIEPTSVSVELVPSYTVDLG